MFGIGPMELVVIALVAVVFVGPQKLPEAMRKIGRIFVQVRRQTQDVRDGFNDVVRSAERELELDKIRELKAKMDTVRSSDLIQRALSDKSGKDAKDCNDPVDEDHDHHHGHEDNPDFLLPKDLSPSIHEAESSASSESDNSPAKVQDNSETSATPATDKKPEPPKSS